MWTSGLRKYAHWVRAPEHMYACVLKTCPEYHPGPGRTAEWRARKGWASSAGPLRLFPQLPAAPQSLSVMHKWAPDSKPHCWTPLCVASLSTVCGQPPHCVWSASPLCVVVLHLGPLLRSQPPV